MRIPAAFLLALCAAGCTVTVDVDPGAVPSALLSDFRPGQFMQAFADSERAVLRTGSGAEGMTRHEGRQYHRRRYVYRMEGAPDDPQAFARRLRAAMKDAIGRHVGVTGEGDATIGAGMLSEIRQFDFDYHTDEVRGWVSVSCIEQPDGVAVLLDLHEAEI